MKVVPSSGSLSLLYGQAGKPPRLHLPPLHHLHKEKAAALAGISSWRRKTVFCNACAPWCRQIRSLWLSTGLRKTTYSVTDRLYLHQCTKQHQELLPGDGAHLMTQTANPLQTSTACFTSRPTTALPHNPWAWFECSRSQETVPASCSYTAPLSMKVSNTDKG